MYEQIATMSAAGAVPLAGMGARVARRAARSGAPTAADLINVQGKDIQVRKPSDNINNVINSNFEYPKIIGNQNLNINDVYGGVRFDKNETQRVKDLSEKIIGENGYISRIIVDQNNNIVEGQHRLEALRQLGASEVPVYKIEELADTMPVGTMKEAINTAGKIHSDHVNQIMQYALENIAKEGMEGARNFDFGNFQKYYNAALDAAAPSPLQGTLDMSQAARMQRAAEQGFDVDNVMYHGTMNSFDSFDGPAFFTSSPNEASAYAGTAQMANARRAEKMRGKYTEAADASELFETARLPYVGIISDIPFSQRGKWWATDQGVVRVSESGKVEVATGYEVDYDAAFDNGNRVGIKPGDGNKNLTKLKDDVEDYLTRLDTDFGQGQVIPVFLPKGKYKDVDPMTANLLGKRLQGNLSPDVQNRLDKLLANIEQWKKEGYIGIETISDEGALMGESVPQRIVFDPSNIRSTNAAFDPAKRDSSNITFAQGGEASSAKTMLESLGGSALDRIRSQEGQMLTNPQTMMPTYGAGRARGEAFNALYDLFGGSDEDSTARAQATRRAEGLLGAGRLTADFTPGVGDVIALGEAKQALDQGNLGQAAILGGLGMLGMIPVAGDVASRAARKGIDKTSDMFKAYHGTPHVLGSSQRVLDTTTGKEYVASPEMVAPIMRANPDRYKVISQNPLGAFDLNRVGTGEGAQAFGYGTYLTELPDIGRGYRTSLLRRHDIEDMPKIGDRPITDLYSEIDKKAAKLPPSQARAEYDKLEIIEKLMIDGDILSISERKSDFTPEAFAWFENNIAPTFNRPGALYEAQIKVPQNKLLDWDAPVSEQSPEVLEALQRAGIYNPELEQRVVLLTNQKELLALDRDPVRGNMRNEGLWHDLSKEIEDIRKKQPANMTGRQAYYRAAPDATNQAQASQALLDNGIPGIKYLDQGSRDVGEGTRNFVIFDPKTIEVVAKYSGAGVAAGLSALQLSKQDEDQQEFAQGGEASSAKIMLDRLTSASANKTH
jgi:hypothetical protein